jgi:hypothetical protein
LRGEVFFGAAQSNLAPEVVVGVGVVLAGAVRPAEVARLGDPVELDLSLGAARGAGGAGVGAVVAEVDDAGGLVDAHPEGVAEAHRVDLGPGLVGAGREEVAVRDGIRSVGVDLDAQDLAAQVVGVARRTLGVVGGVAGGALVDRGVAVRGERVGVVAGREVQVALRVEVDVAAHVAADAPGGGHVEDLLLAGQIQCAVRLQHEPGEPVDAVERGEVGGWSF